VTADLRIPERGIHRLLPLVVLLFFTQSNCSREKRPEDLNPALGSITAGDLLGHVKILATDKFEGRAPATRGEKLTVDYLTAQFKGIGLNPGNPDGTYVQEVPMVGIKGKPTVYFTIGGQRLALNCPADYLAVSRHSQPISLTLLQSSSPRIKLSRSPIPAKSVWGNGASALS